MWGIHIRSLQIEVYKTTENSWTVVEVFKGNLGNMWHCNGIELPSIDNTDPKRKVLKIYIYFSVIVVFNHILIIFSRSFVFHLILRGCIIKNHFSFNRFKNETRTDTE